MDIKIEAFENKELNDVLSCMANKIQDYTNKHLEHIKNLQNIAVALSTEKDENRIFDLILEEAINYTKADGATIYSVSENKKYLDFKVVYNRTLNLRMGGTHGEIKWPPLPLYVDGQKRMKHMATYVYHTAKSENVEDVYQQTYFDTSGTKAIDEKNNYRTKSMMTIPLKDHEDEVLGVIQLLNAQDDKGNVIPFNKNHMTMLNSLASQTAITFTNRKLIADLENLLFKFIKVIAGAIDRKSEYTGGHIRRVAELTSDFADKICAADFGKFKDIVFDEDELREINISGWLHDIGKIITPVHVMDKPRKLVRIYDRVEHIRTRFDLVKQVIEKDILVAKYEGDDDLIKEKKPILEKIEADYEFIKKKNFGGEFVSKEDMNRIVEIQNFRYCSEGKEYFLISDDEAYNLKIQRGTLTKEEIEKIREHAQTTLDMLSQLDFPKKYAHVPDFASSHHEKLNGEGYPRRLQANEIALQSRIICISDVFEALTANDRPYKEGKTVSNSLKILGFMAKDGEIDKDLLDLFMDSKLYLEFAKKHLSQEQIDDFKIEDIKKLYHAKS